MLTESSQQISYLSSTLSLFQSNTIAATSTCNGLTRRAKHLDSLTSPASESNASLTQASNSLSATLALLKDAREKFDTVSDCEPALERLYSGAVESMEQVKRYNLLSGTTNINNNNRSGGNTDNDEDDNNTVATYGTLNNTGGGGVLATINTILTEQDVYAAADSMEIVRDAYAYFQARPTWKSSPRALGNLERIYQKGMDAMCMLIESLLLGAGPGVRKKRRLKWNTKGGNTIAPSNDMKGPPGINHKLPYQITTTDESTVGTMGTFGTIGDHTFQTMGTTAGGYAPMVSYSTETAADTRIRLGNALQRKDLMKSVGEYEEHFPFDTRTVRELRAIFECLGGDGSILQQNNVSNLTITKSLSHFLATSGKVGRTEKIGSGYYCALVKNKLQTGFAPLDKYSEIRKQVAYQSIQNFYLDLFLDRQTMYDKKSSFNNYSLRGVAATSGAMDAAARDVVRCLEHAMVVVSGEKSIYRCIVSPTSSHSHDTTKVPHEYKQALVASYSYVVSSVVDRVMDIVEVFFMKDAGLVHQFSSSSSTSVTNSLMENDSNAGGSTSTSMLVPTVRFGASSAACSLRVLDGVRMLGPSLAKLCEMGSSEKKGLNQMDNSTTASDVDSKSSLASNLCIAIHRTAVKCAAKAMESLASAIKHDPLDGEKFRPGDARVAAVSSDVVRAIRLISPFGNSYRTVTKRRALPWDVKIGEAAGDIEYFIRHLVMTLLSNLQNKAVHYTRDQGPIAEAKSHLFMMNNTFYLLEQLGYDYSKEAAPVSRNDKGNEFEEIDGDEYKIQAPWFDDQVNKLFETSKKKYVTYWDVLNKYLTKIDRKDLGYQDTSLRLLTLDSGRLIKARFSGFNEEFERLYGLHKDLNVIDEKLRLRLLQDVSNVFMPRYTAFFNEYSKIQFSKKNMDEYLKYPPQKVQLMMDRMFNA